MKNGFQDKHCQTRFFKSKAGFTLLEVLIALTILAISSMAVISQTGQSLTALERLELKTMALWVAENQINAYQMADKWPDVGRDTQNISTGGLSWLVESRISTTRNPLMRKIDVDVALGGTREAVALVSLTAFRGKH